MSPPDENHMHKWMAYYRTVDRILSQQAEPDLNLAMRQAATACGLHRGRPHGQETTTPHRYLRFMVNAIWRDKQDLHMAIHSHDPHTQQSARFPDSTVTNDPNVVLEEVLNSFKRQHNTDDEELSDYTKKLISHLPTLYNRTQRRDRHRTPFTIRELDEVLHKMKPGKTPGVDGLPAQLYHRLPGNMKRHLTARLLDIAIGRTDIPPDRANPVHPLYKKGDLANLDNWRPIVRATT